MQISGSMQNNTRKFAGSPNLGASRKKFSVCVWAATMTCCRSLSGLETRMRRECARGAILLVVVVVRHWSARRNLLCACVHSWWCHPRGRNALVAGAARNRQQCAPPTTTISIGSNALMQAIGRWSWGAGWPMRPPIPSSSCCQAAPNQTGRDAWRTSALSANSVCSRNEKYHPSDISKHTINVLPPSENAKCNTANQKESEPRLWKKISYYQSEAKIKRSQFKVIQFKARNAEKRKLTSGW